MHRREHICESPIYWNEAPSLINEKCNFDYYHELTPEPSILNAGDYLLLVLPSWFGIKKIKNNQIQTLKIA